MPRHKRFDTCARCGEPRARCTCEAAAERVHEIEVLLGRRRRCPVCGRVVYATAGLCDEHVADREPDWICRGTGRQGELIE